MSGHNRTPISFLQEICSKKGIVPQYEVLSSEGPIHDPVFVIQCVIPNYSITAKGSSKKKAKHIASFLVLMNMFKNKDINETEGCTINDLLNGSFRALGENFLDNIDTSNLDLNFASEITNPEETNPVGKLQDMCRKNRWPMPIYEIETFLLPDNTIEYECTLTLWTWVHKANGISKKLAKKYVALKCYEEIVSKKLMIPKEALESMEISEIPCEENAEENSAEESLTTKVTNRALSGLFLEIPPKGKKSRIDPSPIINPLTTNLNDIFDKTLEIMGITCEEKMIQKDGQSICFYELKNLFPQQIVASPPCDTETKAKEIAKKRTLLFLNSMTSKRPVMNFNEWFEE